MVHRWLALGLAGATVVSSVEVAAEPARRVVVADPDPALHRALATTLAPWRLELVLDDTAPRNTTEAEARARVHDARFVVWRRDGDLVVFDRERGAAEHREGVVGPLDDADAASAALTVKTLMRLPPPTATPPGGSAPPVPGIARVRVQASLAGRLDDSGLGARFSAGLFYRPVSAPVRAGLVGEVGSATDVDAAGFRGTVTDASLAFAVSYTIERGGLEIEPFVQFGIARAHLRGEEGSILRDDSTSYFQVRPGAWVRYRVGAFTVGAALDAVIAPGTPTYTKSNAPTEIFQVPAFGVTLGLVGAVDFGS